MIEPDSTFMETEGPVIQQGKLEEVFSSMTYKRSATIGKLVGAMCKAQMAFTVVRKDSENPAFARGGKPSKYADLCSIVNATRDALNKNGLTIMQFPNMSLSGKSLVVETLLAHESEEWISCELVLPAADDRGFTAHTIGKAMTYARRYSWQAITGAVADDDDDGNAASGIGSREAAQAVAKAKAAQALISDNPKVRKIAEEALKPTTLFFTYPEKHNGNYAEFINIREFAAGMDQVAAEGLRQTFAPFLSKTKAKDGSVLIPKENMQALLEKLVGEAGIDVHELKAND